MTVVLGAPPPTPTVGHTPQKPAGSGSAEFRFGRFPRSRRVVSAPGVRGPIAQKYLEVAEVIATEDGTAINVAVGLAVLACIAAADSICIAATGERYSGQEHAAAAELLGRVDRDLGRRLRDLVDLKPASRYGESLLNVRDRTKFLIKLLEDRRIPELTREAQELALDY